jgi:hypothetical protein
MRASRDGSYRPNLDSYLELKVAICVAVKYGTWTVDLTSTQALNANNHDSPFKITSI